MKKLCVNLSLISLVLLLCLIAVLNFTNSSFSSALTTSSGRAMCVLDSNSGRVLYSKNMDEKLKMASTTKVVTAITVIENCDDLNEIITIDDKAVGVEGSSIYLRKGEQMKVIDLLYGLMLRSGNDSATALAIHTAGSIENFANLMNNLAEKVGAKNSHFMNPHGLDHPEHYTTAYDLALITGYALKNPIFKEIVSTKTHVVEATNVSEKRYFTNKNKLLSTLDGCCGVKTGYTTKAGRCLVSACERDDTTYVCVVLNCGPMFEESRDLLNSAFDEFENVKILDKNKEIFNEYIIDENHGRLYLYTDEDVYFPLRKGEFSNLVLKYNVDLKDAEVGDEVGEIQIFYENHLIKSQKLYTMNKIDKLAGVSIDDSKLLWEERINEN